MEFVEASAGSLLAFTTVVLFVIASIVWMVSRAYQSRLAGAWVVVGFAVWLGALALLVESGQMQRLPLSGFPLFFGPVVVVWAGLGVSRVGARVAAATPLAVLVGFQAFRLPLELVLHSWATQGTIPESMTWTGQNFDIASGIIALVAAPFAARSRAVAWTANVIGALLLLNVMRVALFSLPLSFGWQVSPPLVIAFHLPYAFIGPVCVGGALFGHILLTRRLQMSQ